MPIVMTEMSHDARKTRRHGVVRANTHTQFQRFWPRNFRRRCTLARDSAGKCYTRQYHSNTHSLSPASTTSSTSTIVVRAALAMSGLKFLRQLEYTDAD